MISYACTKFQGNASTAMKTFCKATDFLLHGDAKGNPLKND